MLSIRDFLTDGSLPAICDALSSLAGVQVVLRDSQGNRIIATGDPLRGAPSEDPAGHAPDSVEFRLGEHLLGCFSVGEAEPERARQLVRVLRLLALTVEEVCRNDVELHHRIDDISVLYRLSALLAKAGGLADVLRIGLDSAVEVLGLDAGSIVLFEEQSDGTLSHDERDLIHMASRGLSREWLTSPLPLSEGRVFDRLALDGQIVAVADLLSDPRVAIKEQATREGLRSTVQAGLVFHDKPLGVIRLYSRTSRVFTESEMRLVRSVAQQLAVAVEQSRLLAVQQEERRIQRQLALAADIQRRMLPRSIPTSERFEFTAHWTPSLELSGDFYDFIELGRGRVGVLIGDVVGKGVPAALLMSHVRTSVRAHSGFGESVSDVISNVNRDLCRDTLEGEFASIWYGVFDPGEMTLECCSGGHDQPLLARRMRAGHPHRVAPLPMKEPGLLVGIDPAEKYSSITHRLESGDCIVAYTDGVTDMFGPRGDRFGRAGLMYAVSLGLEQAQTAGGDGAANVLDAVFRGLRQHGGLAKRIDDQTVVVVTVAQR